MNIVKKGDFVLINPETIKGSAPSIQNQPGLPGKGGIGRLSGELETPPDVVGTPEFDPDSDASGVVRTERTLGVKGEETKKPYKSEKSSTSALGKGGSKEKISTKWNLSVSSALSSGKGLSDEVKRLIKQLTEKGKSKVDWKKELKKFVNSAANKQVEVLPNRRFLSSGDVLYGSKREGSDSIRTLVCGVDTSGSISQEQIKVFLEEVWTLCTKYDIGKIIIIYCSDDIDSVDIVKKGKKPDLSKWASTGGNAKGFDPPFKWVQDNKIKPTVFIYLTDSFASYPASSKYGIDKYKDRVFWFICNATKDFNKPPFGKYIHVPMDSKGNFI